jgi:glyoxylase-like metal-dependent hydrolase (beta-lactamase superfamily II)
MILETAFSAQTTDEDSIVTAAARTKAKPQHPEVTPFFDEGSNTFSYVVVDPQSRHCAIIDPVMDFDQASGTASFEGADRIIAFVTRENLALDWILETHVHADHLSSAPYLKEHLGGKIGIGKNITVVQETFGAVFNEGDSFKRDGSQFDHLFTDEESFQVGTLQAQALHTPGHTPACMTFLLGDAVFVGDTLFMPDSGTARADFPGGDARVLYASIRRILALPGEMRLFMCHDYCANGRGVEYETTVEQERLANIHVNDTIGEDEFVSMREARDATLDMPQLILPSLQVNMRGGRLPEPDDSGTVFLKLPVNAFS